MKKQIILLVQVLAFLSAVAQSPEKMSYQAVIRDADDLLVTNQTIGMRVTILQGSATGIEVYKETYNPNPQTNDNGLVTLAIGSGNPVIGNFGAIPWENGPFFIKTETDPDDSTNYSISGTSQLLSVPYALFAKSVDNLMEVDPVFTAHPAYGITSGSIDNWNTAYGWGDHAVEGYLLNEEQVLSISGDTIFLTGGSFVVLPATGWSLNGNTGTLSGTNYIGTSDNQALDFRTNNVLHTRITTKGQIETLNTGSSVFLGENAGEADDLSDNSNVFVGNISGQANISGQDNTAAGFGSLGSNTTGNYNTVQGRASLYFNTTGSANTALGYAALYNNLAGSNATAIGVNAMYRSNSTATPFINSNVALGYEALIGSNNPSANTGNFNTALGYQTIYNNSAGEYNSAAGYKSLYANTTGTRNAAFGAEALNSNTTGSYNSAFGRGALYLNTTGTYNTAKGYLALYNNTIGERNAAFGAEALYSNNSGSYNSAFGRGALYLNTTGTYNTAKGYLALYNNTIGERNAAYGAESMYSNNSGSYNSAFGRGALYANTTGAYNTAIGYNADVTQSNFTNATAIGSSCTVDASNKVRIGNTSVTSIGGQVSWSVFSDERIKRDVRHDVPGLAFIKLLQPVTYHYDIHLQNKLAGMEETGSWEGQYDIEKTKFSGFIAQEVEAAAKSIGYDFSGIDDSGVENGGFYSIRYSEFVVPLVKAVQEQQAMIEDLRNENEMLKKRMAALEGGR